MVILTKNKIRIESPIDKVYDFVVNMENFGKWFPDVINIKSHNKLKHGTVGKKYLETVKDPFKGNVNIIINVKEAQKNKLFITEGKYPPLLPRVIINFSKVSDTVTNITWTMESRCKSIFVKMSLIQIAKIIMRKRAKIGVLKLKELLER